MEIFLNREEIRRRMAARLGHMTGDAQAPLIQEQHNEFIRSACMQVANRCHWVRNKQETRVTVGIDQRFINYPTNSGPGNILSLGAWSETNSFYWPLRRRVIVVAQDDEPLVDAGEPASLQNRGRPIQYEMKNQIEIWPRPDQEYEIKIDHTVEVDLTTDSTVSVVDAEAICLLAIADAYDFQGEPQLANTQRQRADMRMDMLIRFNSADVIMKRGGDAYTNRAGGGYFPNSGVWPSVMPT